MRGTFCYAFMIFCFLAFQQVRAQNDCSRSLIEAGSKLDLGRFYEIPGLLEGCLKNGFSKEEKISAYRLLTLAYLYLDYQEKADSVYLKLLRLSPEYDPSATNEPSEYINHHLLFTTKPNIYLVAKSGVNVTRPTVLAHYSLSNSELATEQIVPLVGFALGGGAEFTLTNNLHLGVDLLYSKMGFQIKDQLLEGSFYRPQLKNMRQQWEVPIYAKYVLWWKKWSPFVEGGLTPSLLIDARMQDITGSFVRAGEDEQPIRPVATMNVSLFRRQFNYSLMAGFGLQYKIGINYLIFETRYNMGMLNAVSAKNRWRLDYGSGRDLKFYPSLYVDDDYRLNNLVVMVSFVKPLYKPRKIKTKK